MKKVAALKNIDSEEIISIETTAKKYEDLHFVDTSKSVWNYSLFTDEDVINFQAGTNYSMYKFLGNKQLQVLETWGTYFAVWAPNATFVSVTL